MAEAEKNLNGRENLKSRGGKLRSRIVIIGLGVVLIAGSVLAAYIVYSGGRGGDPVILRADPAPYKVKPADPGGKQLDNLESPMMERFNKGITGDEGAEVLVPPEEEPEFPPISLEVTTAEAEATAPLSEEGEAGAEADDSANQQTQTAANGADAPDTADATDTTDSTDAPDTADSTDATDKADSTHAADAPDAQNATDENRFFVQFAAFRSEENARKAAAVLTTKHASRLDGMTLNATHKGEYWRVVSDPLSSEKAAAMCRIFRSVGQDCIVKSLD